MLLALFLGGFGVHKFYLGRTGFGLLYLVFCWTFIPAFVALLDLVLLLLQSDASFDLDYNGPAVLARAAAATNAANAASAAHAAANAAHAAANAAHAAKPDIPRQIAALHDLQKSGALTEAEFKEQKQRLLAS